MQLHRTAILRGHTPDINTLWIDFYPFPRCLTSCSIFRHWIPPSTERWVTWCNIRWSTSSTRNTLWHPRWRGVVLQNTWKSSIQSALLWNTSGRSHCNVIRHASYMTKPKILSDLSLWSYPVYLITWAFCSFPPVLSALGITVWSMDGTLSVQWVQSGSPPWGSISCPMGLISLSTMYSCRMGLAAMQHKVWIIYNSVVMVTINIPCVQVVWLKTKMCK